MRYINNKVIPCNELTVLAKLNLTVEYFFAVDLVSIAKYTLPIGSCDQELSILVLQEALPLGRCDRYFLASLGLHCDLLLEGQ